ncbi:bifunctional folylpolyglutamate synthase/dihydrofolate synthase [Sphingomonas nostoxanthinifaciens]|uniref:bifunctional folylpolyglutamate synthase/dihydrofolate synthase n=1 Tax=Sphingomonas nostoxanthinifaciens TaxID=2872652 RepID=UPI001CC202F7|nr:folylpolyglutamate synthase/dihydrofolate synthase family protein [Sphingomonas nostoxanthinifaciens]UAK23904.1 bifunctional folylpolyglutamate synthase/dihydrofolate synthase [Sphingomonas nostoxanthinifaciens]
MPDHAVSSNPAVQRQLDRLATLSPGADILGLERIATLLARLGNPERALPPVFHVAGTNGKGSTCAFLRTALEAAGHKVHVYTSPHLVRFNERIRLAGTLIDDAMLAALLDEVLSVADGVSPSFFEVTTAAAFLAFARVPADACVIEVGLGGRLDATNVLATPVACGITQLGIDHQALLGDTIEVIAGEKAGIAKAGVPLLTQRYAPPVAAPIEAAAAAAGALWLPRDGVWRASVQRGQLHYEDAVGTLDLPVPRLPGSHQAGNAALAVAMLRHQTRLAVPPAALRAAMGWAEWPARLQRITTGTLAAALPEDGSLWLDGGHNPAAARAIAEFFRSKVTPGQPFELVLGMLANKDLAGFLEPFAGSVTRIHAVPVPGHAHHDAAAVTAAAQRLGIPADGAATIGDALALIAARQTAPLVLIGGSLYLAGEALAANGTPPA